MLIATDETATLRPIVCVRNMQQIVGDVLMKRVSRAARGWLISASVLAVCPLVAQAGDGPYVGVEGGVNWQSPQDQDAGGVVLDRLHFKRGFEAGGVGGYSFMNGWRPELELSYRRNPLSDAFTSTHDQADGALANV